MVYGFCSGNYGIYGYNFLSVFVNILIIAGLVLLIILLYKKIQKENNSETKSKNERRLRNEKKDFN